jgi:hypothetical protein
MDDPNLAEALFQAFLQVIFEKRVNLTGRKGMEIQGIRDWHPHGPDVLRRTLADRFLSVTPFFTLDSHFRFLEDSDPAESQG